MRIVLVGLPKERERLRRALAGTSLEVVDETATVAAARERGIDADALVLAAAGSSMSTNPEPFAEPLTAREVEVLAWMAEGLPNKAIATRLRISDQTVKFHVASICGKLGALNRTDAVRLAIRRGLVTL